MPVVAHIAGGARRAFPREDLFVDLRDHLNHQAGLRDVRGFFRKIIPVVTEGARDTQRIVEVFHDGSQILRFSNPQHLQVFRRIRESGIRFRGNLRLAHARRGKREQAEEEHC